VPLDAVAALLQRLSSGDASARDELIQLIYPELRRLAHWELRRERPGHTLQSSALVNEFYMRIARERDAQWRDRAHFLAVSAQIMRRILVDYARARQREKHGGGVPPLRLIEELDVPAHWDPNLIALDDALNDLARLDPQQSHIVELRFFAGLSVEETAEALGLSKATVNRHWALARAWLIREMSRSGN
jgi:RNA polymerase sigma factor (TIGR02999 family)